MNDMDIAYELVGLIKENYMGVSITDLDHHSLIDETRVSLRLVDGTNINIEVKGSGADEKQA